MTDPRDSKSLRCNDRSTPGTGDHRGCASPRRRAGTTGKPDGTRSGMRGMNDSSVKEMRKVAMALLTSSVRRSGSPTALPPSSARWGWRSRWLEKVQTPLPGWCTPARLGDSPSKPEHGKGLTSAALRAGTRRGGSGPLRRSEPRYILWKCETSPGSTRGHAGGGRCSARSIPPAASTSNCKGGYHADPGYHSRLVRQFHDRAR